jgi:hypothetical protein
MKKLPITHIMTTKQTGTRADILESSVRSCPTSNLPNRHPTLSRDGRTSKNPPQGHSHHFAEDPVNGLSLAFRPPQTLAAVSATVEVELLRRDSWYMWTLMRASTRYDSINSIGSFSCMHRFSHDSCRNWLRISSTCFPCAKVMVFESSLTLVYRSRYPKMTRKLCITGSSLSPMRYWRASCLHRSMACASAAAERTT